MDQKLQHRREWVQGQRTDYGKIPADLDKYYEQFEDKVEMEEQIKREREEEEAAEKEARAPKKKGMKKGGKKKKGGREDKQKDDRFAKVGPNELVRKFDDFYDDFNSKWANMNEEDNPKQQHDKQMTLAEVMPQV